MNRICSQCGGEESLHRTGYVRGHEFSPKSFSDKSISDEESLEVSKGDWY